MKRIVKDLFTIFMTGIIFGVFVWIYFLIFPENYSDYDKKIYYVNNENKIEQSWISRSKDDLLTLLDYYGQRDSLPDGDAIMRGSSKDLAEVDYEAKTKLLRMINDSIAKVIVYQNGPVGDYKVKLRGYVPLFLLHDSIPDSLITE